MEIIRFLMKNWMATIGAGVAIVALTFVSKIGWRYLNKPNRPPAEKRNYKRSELAEFNGKNLNKPILIGVKGKVYDVSKGEMFYGPGEFFLAFQMRWNFAAFFDFLLVWNQSNFDSSGNVNIKIVGGGYADLAGKDATRVLATMDFTAEGGNWDDLDEVEMKSLDSWVEKYQTKYLYVGDLTD